jgi:putative transposase
MPDHIHLILQPYGQHDLSYIMKMIKGSFARKYNKIRFQYGKVWQDRYYETGIRGSLELIKKVEYIHNNPVRANIVLSPEEYPFSSFRHYFCYSQEMPKNYNFIQINKIES